MASIITPPLSRGLDAKDRAAEPTEIVLDNGLRVILAERPGSPIVETRFALGSGFAADPNGRNGLAGLAMAMFSEGALRVGGEPLVILQESLGATFTGRALADGAIMEVSALTANFHDVLAICGRFLANVQFEREDFERIRANRRGLIARERRNPTELALRILPAKLFGTGHPYAQPFSGSGYEESVANVSADQVENYYEANFTPEAVTLVIVGPLTIRDAVPLLERTLGQLLGGRSKVTNPASAEVALIPRRINGSAITVMDRPKMEQVALVMGLPTIARNSVEAEALRVADAVMAGMFSSRLNLKLREEKGWTYGVRSSLIDARLGGLWLLTSFVSREQLVAAMTEISAEVDNIAGTRPCSEAELRHAVEFLISRVPGMRETCSQIADMLARDFIWRLPFERERETAARLQTLESRDITEVCRKTLQASEPHWVVVGDMSELEGPLRQAGFTRVSVLEPGSIP